jgi:hypothetical protein
MTVVAAFISDRGDKYLPGCVESFCTYMPRVEATTVIDDSEHHMGMAGAVKAAWKWALDENADYLFHVEEDFLFRDRIPLYYMVTILRNFPHLAQLVLKRQPWSAEEKQAGGRMQMNPELYKQRGYAKMSWVEHRWLFSLNPCLIPRRTLELEWEPGDGGAERSITDACLNAGLRFAYYGHRDDPPRCEHVGYQRSAGYRW